MFKHIGLLGPFHSQTIARSISNLLGYKPCRGLPPKLRSAKTQKRNLRRQTICEAYLQLPTDSLFPSGSESSLLLQFSKWHFTADGETFTTALMERPKVTMNLATNEHHYRPFVKNRSERELTNEGMKQRAWLPPSLLHAWCPLPLRLRREREGNARHFCNDPWQLNSPLSLLNSPLSHWAQRWLTCATVGFFSCTTFICSSLQVETTGTKWCMYARGSDIW